MFAGGSATYLSQPPVPVAFKTDAPLVGFPTTHRLTNGFTYFARRRLGVPRLYDGELHRRYSAGEALAVWFSSWGHLLNMEPSDTSPGAPETRGASFSREPIVGLGRRPFSGA